MPIDSTKQLTPGEPLKLSASVWNKFVEMYNRMENILDNATPSGLIGDSPLYPSNTVIVKNSSGADRDAGDVLYMTDGIAEFSDNLLAVNERPHVDGSVPTSELNPVCILLDPIDQDKYGRAAVGGMVTTTVNVTNITHKYATPTAGDATALTSAATGPICIIDTESGTTGSTPALVLFSRGPAGQVEVVKITSRTGSGGYWPGTRYIDDGAGGLTTGEEIRVKLTPAGGTIFEAVDYWAKRSGTYSGFPLYYGIGNVEKNIKDCVDSVSGYRPWTIPQWYVGDFVAGSPP
jgi:hypothetical protein